MQVTTVRRVHIKMIVAAFAFDLYQLCTLKMPKSSRPSGSYRKMIEKERISRIIDVFRARKV